MDKWLTPGSSRNSYTSGASIAESGEHVLKKMKTEKVRLDRIEKSTNRRFYLREKLPLLFSRIIRDLNSKYILI